MCTFTFAEGADDSSGDAAGREVVSMESYTDKLIAEWGLALDRDDISMDLIERIIDVGFDPDDGCDWGELSTMLSVAGDRLLDMLRQRLPKEHSDN